MTSPPEDTVVWRYLDFPEFLDMLERWVLWFAQSMASTIHSKVLHRFGAGSPSFLAVGRDAFWKCQYRRLPSARADIVRATTFISCWRAILFRPYRPPFQRQMKSAKLASTNALRRLRGEAGELWQPRFFDHTLRTVEDYWGKVPPAESSPGSFCRRLVRGAGTSLPGALQYAHNKFPLIPKQETVGQDRLFTA